MITSRPDTDTMQPLLVKDSEAFDRMPQEYKNLVIKQLMVHTEGELSGADDYIEIFYPMTHDLYEKKVCCERAMEELEHYERGSAVLLCIGVDTSYMLKQKLQDRPLFATEAVKKINNWAERGLFSYLGETAVLEMLKEMGQSSYKPIADMCVPVIKDELVHIAHGFRITRALCRSDEGKTQVQTALQRLWPVVLDMFGKSQSKTSEQYVRWGLRRHSNETARQKFIQLMMPKLQELGLLVPNEFENRSFL